MPLDKSNGEIGELGRNFRVVPVAKWADTPLFNQACEEAAKAFKATGALSPIRFLDSEIVVQEYPQSDKLEFVFLRGIAGQEHFYRYVFDLPKEMTAELAVTGRWNYASIN